MSMEKETKHSMNYIISAIDYFTKYCELGAFLNKEEMTVVIWTYNNMFCR